MNSANAKSARRVIPRKQRGIASVIAVAILAVSGAMIFVYASAVGKTGSEINRQHPHEAVSRAESIFAEILIQNPGLWDIAQWSDLKATLAGIPNSVELPEGVIVHISPRRESNGIAFRNFVLCLNCADANPFADGSYDPDVFDENQPYLALDGLRIQNIGIARAREDVHAISRTLIRNYRTFRRINAELDKCDAGEDDNLSDPGLGGEDESGGEDGVSAERPPCYFFLGCGFGNNGGICGQRKQACPSAPVFRSVQDIDIFRTKSPLSVWGGNLQFQMPCKDEEHIVLRATGPLDAKIQVGVAPPL